jgi:enoyl-CoA hydratase
MDDTATELPVLTEVRGRVLLITLNRPEAMNSINSALAEGLAAAIARLDDDDALSVGVLTGNGRGFSAGMDLKAFAKEGTPKAFLPFAINGARKPLIAAVEGFALAGGLEIALTCDLIVAAEGAKLGIPEAKVGLLAAGGALLRLPGRVPDGLAMELALTGDPITAERAHAVGLVARLAAPGTAVDVALELAERIARNAPLSTAGTKAVLRKGRGLTAEEFWAMQTAETAHIFTSADAIEGATAFAQKREPNWTGT